jgi:thioredoxin-like negative regulator of GroEL
MSRTLAGLMLVHAVLSASPLAGQQEAMARAFDLERRGSYSQAVDIYKAALREKPADIAALLGLERSLVPLNRTSELLPLVRRALASGPVTAPVYAVGLRAYAAADLLDSLPRLVEAWSRAVPGDETPYREWAAAALQRRDRPMARRAYQLGRERLGKPDALAAEIAQLAILEEDWVTAAHEWTRAVRRLPGYRPSAIATLDKVPDSLHTRVLDALEHDPGAPEARIAVDLRARWGDPVGALNALLRGLPAAPGPQIELLQAFLEETRSGNTPPYLLAQGRVLEALADRWTNAAQQAQLRLESARAYAAAGERPAARRMLTLIASDSSSGPSVVGGAMATLIELLVAEGNADEASTQLERHRSAMPVDDYLRLRRGIAARWAREGYLDSAETMLAGDSSVEALALQGRFRLYSGDLKGASDLWKQAGPFAGSREDATERSGLLALLQPIGADSLAALGHAFRELDGGDTLSAAREFDACARKLPVDGGRAEVMLFAARLYAAAGQPAAAEPAFRAAVLKEAPGTAAAALLELGRLLLDQKRGAEASQVLEQMILDYPTSVLVPQARRVLDQSRGAVPRT